VARIAGIGPLEILGGGEVPAPSGEAVRLDILVVGDSVFASQSTRPPIVHAMATLPRILATSELSPAVARSVNPSTSPLAACSNLGIGGSHSNRSSISMPPEMRSLPRFSCTPPLYLCSTSFKRFWESAERKTRKSSGVDGKPALPLCESHYTHSSSCRSGSPLAFKDQCISRFNHSYRAISSSYRQIHHRYQASTSSIILILLITFIQRVSSRYGFACHNSSA